jgi:ribosomal protein L14E/L6E/L27E
MNSLEPYEFGRLVYSKAGHDKGKLYVICRADSEYVYLVDGLYRKLSEPKKKRIKHIQVINHIADILVEKQASSKKVIDEDVKRSIKLYLKQ